jgi:hypothetical protein
MKTMTVSPAAVARARAIARKAPFLPPPIAADWQEQPRLYLNQGEPWLLLPAERDPLRTVKGEVAIPRAALADLQRIVDADVDFDRLAVAHEIDPARVPARIRAALPANGLDCTDEVAEALIGKVPPPPSANRRLADGLDKVVATLAGATQAAGDLAGAVLDPIIFGVIPLTGALTPGQPALYYPLAAWRW